MDKRLLEVIQIRVSKDDKVAIKRHAKMLHMTISDYIRYSLMKQLQDENFK